MLTFSNPRKYFETDQWPSGFKRVTAIFEIESNKKGERVKRITEKTPGAKNFGKPKTTTYCVKARIVDGSDGKTYIAELTQYGFITIMQSSLKVEETAIHPRDDNYQEVLKLFEEEAND